MWSLELITAPVKAPLDRETEVRQQLRLEDDQIKGQHIVLDAYIEAARHNCEFYTMRQLITATWELWMDGWYEDGIYRCDGYGEYLVIPRPPLVSITSITYLDSNGTPVVWPSDQYTLSTNVGPTAPRARVSAAYGVPFPVHRSQTAAIKIRFVSGYGLTYLSVPAALRMGMLLDVQASYDGDPSGGAGTTLNGYRHTAQTLWGAFRAW